MLKKLSPRGLKFQSIIPFLSGMAPASLISKCLFGGVVKKILPDFFTIFGMP